MKTFRSLFPVALAATALLLAAVTSGCDNHTAAPTAQAITHAPSAALAATVQTAPAAEGAPEARQGTFTITGTMPSGLKEGDGVTVTLKALDPEGKENVAVATTKAEHGRFTLTGSVAQPLPGAVIFSPHVYARMIVEGGTFTVVNNGAGSLVVKGGHYNDQVYGYKWMPAFVAASKAANAADAKAFAGVNVLDKKAMTAARKATEHVYDSEQNIEHDYESKILDGNSDPLLKLFVLSHNSDGKRYDEAKRAAMYAEYERTLGANPVILHMRQGEAMLAKSKKAQTTVGIGKPYKDVVVADVNGKQVKLSDVLTKNKLVLLDFWASWCSPCRGEFPFMGKVYKEFHGQGFEIYAVSIDVDHGEWVKALREEGAAGRIPWINLVDPAGFDAKSAVAYGVDGLPSNFLISSDGTIVGVNMREWNLRKTVQAQLKKLAGSHGG